MTTTLRIHPAIGFARVGNSTDYYLQPETVASIPQAGQVITGGLPIRKNTENTTITSADIRDQQGRLKRQAARFKIYQYNDANQPTYPSTAGDEVTIGSMVNGKKVIDIIWMVHLANKKANCWEIDEDANKGLELYENGNTPPLRNPDFENSDSDPAEKIRLQKLVIDAGPRCVRSGDNYAQPTAFNSTTTASYWDATNNIIQLKKDYPQTYPASNGNDPTTKIDYLGEILTDDSGRLIVVGGFGKACGFNAEGDYCDNAALDKDVDNDNWLDDTSDGPVHAVLVFADQTFQTLENGAWVISTDPAYAPQTLNAVSLWDDIYTTWVENFGLNPALYNAQSKTYQTSYVPNFQQDVFPTLRSAEMQRWNTNLPEAAIKSHKKIDALTSEKPAFNIMSFMRKPTNDGTDHLETGSPLMPLSLGDADKSFMTLTTTQYFLMEQWANGKCANSAKQTIAQRLGAGEALDRAVLMNCLGGRFSPGIDMTFIVRDLNLFNADWKNPNTGPFRINEQKLDYASATKDMPFLGVGYIPLRKTPAQPGDLSKFMAIPWHTDYNSCATHTPAPNPKGAITEQNIYAGDVNTTLFWSWPAQRPVAVYTFEDVSKREDSSLPPQRYSVRGEGTSASGQNITFNPANGKMENSPASNVGRFQDRKNILLYWQDIGTIIQAAAIENCPENIDPNYYLEVASNFKQDDSNLVQPWANTVTDKVYPPNK